MHCELITSFHSVPQAHESPPLISTNLSLSSTTFQSKSNHNHGGATTHHHHHHNSKNKNRRRWPNDLSYDWSGGEWSCSTLLELYNNPWKIKKRLTRSDIGKLNRLLFGEDLLEKLMLPVLDEGAQRDAKSGIGAPVRVWDVETMSMHVLVLKRWASFNSFVLIGGWNRDFVKRRGLKEGDEIGFLWDSHSHCFHFSLLKPIHVRCTS